MKDGIKIGIMMGILILAVCLIIISGNSILKADNYIDDELINCFSNSTDYYSCSVCSGKIIYQEGIFSVRATERGILNICKFKQSCGGTEEWIRLYLELLVCLLF